MASLNSSPPRPRSSRREPRYPRQLAVAALAALALCGCEHSHYTGGSGGYDQPSTSGTTQIPWTTSTTDEGTCSPGSIDLTPIVGATAECNACAEQHCCRDAQAFQLVQDETRYSALFYCAIGNGEGPCAEACTVQVCDSGIAYQFFMACGACMNASCCDAWTACVADTTCTWWSCSYDDPTATPECCAAGTSYRAVADCQTAFCASECGASLCGEVGGGGAGVAGGGGSGATGGFGGTAGAGGA